MARLPILVVGARGQLAGALARRGVFDDRPILCRGRPDADLTAPSSLKRVIDEFAPVAVINAAAYTAVEKAETERDAAFAANAEGVGHLAKLCRERDLPLIHISTDYVFDGGQQTPYREDDAIAPLGVYGASKAAGEAAIRRACPRHLILRTSWLYGMEGQNFLTTMLRLAEVREEISVVDDQHGAPTWVEDLSAAILALLRGIMARNASAPWGTYHLTARGTTTWFGFAGEIFRLRAAAGQTVPRLKPVTTAEYPSAVRRPLHSALDCGKIESTFGMRLPAWRDSLERCFSRGEAELPSKEKVA